MPWKWHLRFGHLYLKALSYSFHQAWCMGYETIAKEHSQLKFHQVPTTFANCHNVHITKKPSTYIGDSNGRSSTNQSRVKMRNLRKIYEQTKDWETNIFCIYADDEPLTFQEAVKEDCCQSTMLEEIHAIQSNESWKLTTLPPNQKAICFKWVYKIKPTIEDGVERTRWDL